jgi:cobalt-zinc-cadmium efflux system outer membrane protein
MSISIARRRACGSVAAVATLFAFVAPGHAQEAIAFAPAPQSAGPSGSRPAASPPPLTVETAVARALNAAPEARANAARVDALRAARMQAGVRPNPTIEVVAENVAGTGRYQFVEGTEVTASYAQQIERGGKREARVALVDRDIDLASAEAVVQRLDIARRVQLAYVEAVTAEVMVGVVQERLRVARELQRTVAFRVREARDPLFAGTRADTRVAEAQVDLQLAVHARDAAFGRLADWWGGTREQVAVSIDQFFMLDRPPPRLRETIAPADLAVSEARIRRAEAAVGIERARRVQDPTVRGGVRYLNTTGDLALVGGVSIPLARHDRNQGNIERTQAEVRRAEADLEVARVTRMRELRLAQERVEEARHEAEALLRQVYPGAERTLAQVRAGYAQGGFRFADLDEAQTRLAEVRDRMVRAAAQYHQALVELDRLTGRFADRLPQETQP